MKKIHFILSLGLLITSLYSFSLNKVSAASSKTTYYNQLSNDGKKVYKAFDKLSSNGDFLLGEGNIDLIAEKFVGKNLLKEKNQKELLKTFGAAKDAYKLDHPEIFYVNFDNITLEYGTSNGEYYASLGNNKNLNFLADGISKNKVNAMVNELNSATKVVVDEAKTKSSDYDKVVFVNKYLVDHLTYTYQNEDGSEAEYVHNSYGGLVANKAVCEGYAHSFKIILDQLNIDNVLVQGYAATADGYQPHMWNYVKLNSYWYGVDVTWNDGENLPVDGYLLRGNQVMSADHITDGVISGCKFEFTYPTLNEYDYGITKDKFTIKEDYLKDSLFLDVSYDNKNAESLKNDYNKYLAYRFYPAGYNSETKEFEYKWSDYFYMGSDMLATENVGNSTKINITSFNQMVQFAVIDYAPDEADFQYTNPVDDIHIKQLSQIYYNSNYGSYHSAPFVKKVTPDNKETISAMDTIHVEIEYDESLKKTDNEDINIKVVSEDENIEKYVSIDNVQFNEDKPTVLSFDFTPSPRFEHRETTYSFYPTNLVGSNSNLNPNLVTYMCKKTSVVCNKVFPDERLYIEAYGKPSIVSNSDLSLEGWTYENGEKILSNQRSQMVLVASNTTSAQTQGMEDGINNLEGNSVKSIQTYELEIDICSKYVNIPNGSYVQLSFGFPEGYSYGDENTTYKIYHFKTLEDGSIDYDNPEEVDVVVTPYGLIAQVDSFSPYAIVALDSKGVTTTSKTIYSETTTLGGTIHSSGIKKYQADDKISYQLNVEDGYDVDAVLLNGVDVTDKVVNNEITFNYDELNDNNTLSVSYVRSSYQAPETHKVKFVNKGLLIFLNGSFFVAIIAGVLVVSLEYFKKHQEENKPVTEKKTTSKASKSNTTKSTKKTTNKKSK